MPGSLGPDLTSIPWPHPLFLAAAAAAFAALVGVAVIYTSTLRRRPGRAPDPLQGIPRPVHDALDPRVAYEAGVGDAGTFPFTSAEGVLLALEEICLGRSKLYQEGADYVVEFQRTASSRTAGRSGQRECAYEAGFLEGGLRQVAGPDVSVEEARCRSEGARTCRFHIRGAEFPEAATRRAPGRHGQTPAPWGRGIGT